MRKLLPAAILLFFFQLRGAAQTLDASFGNAGIVANTLGGTTDHIAEAIALQQDGKIVAAVNGDINNTPSFRVIRYNADGTLDNSFGTGGIAASGLNGVIHSANAILIQPDGKIVVTGYYDNGTDYDVMLVRYNANGTLDNSFGTGGLVITDVAFQSGEQAYKIAIQSNGKLVICGWTTNGNFTRKDLLIRYKANGQVDSSFATNGRFIYSRFNTQDEAKDLKIQTDGKIVFTGYTLNPGASFFDALVARLDTNGVLDNSFGTSGTAILNISEDEDDVSGLLIDPSGKIVITGLALNISQGTEYDDFIARFNANGSLDLSFNQTGFRVTDINNLDNPSFAIAAQSDGKYLVCGIAYTSASTPGNLFVLRYNANGSVDAGFGSNGYVITSITAGGGSEGHGLVVQPNGKILACGIHQYNNFSNEGLFICRYNNAGVAPTPVKLTAPNGGETWGVGSVHAITWTNTQTASVKLEYTVNGTSWTTISNSVPTSPPTYSWTIPNSPSTQCKVRVSEVGGTGVDTSDASFTIQRGSGIASPADGSGMLSAYPNPAGDYFTVKVKAGCPVERLHCTVTDVCGREKYESTSSANFTVDCSGWSKGLYYLIAVDAATGTHFTLPIIKQ